MTLPYLLLDIDGVLIPFLPTGRHPDGPVPFWLTPNMALCSPVC